MGVCAGLREWSFALGLREWARVNGGALALLASGGASRRPRHVHGGRATVRHVLYMAAVCAARGNPVLRAFYQRLRDAGKPAALALTAVMRKMLGVLNRLLADPLFSLVH
jgi:transposase